MAAANVTPVLNKEKIRRLIPHAGTMVLLDNVRCWTSDFIECDTVTHLDRTNPLRFGEHLSTTAGIEYAAQAVAIHGSLCSVANNAAPRGGYLAVLSDIEWSAHRLDIYHAPLIVRATQLAALTDAAEYAFSLMFENAIIVAGRMTIALRAERTIALEA